MYVPIGAGSAIAAVVITLMLTGSFGSFLENRTDTVNPESISPSQTEQQQETQENQTPIPATQSNFQTSQSSDEEKERLQQELRDQQHQAEMQRLEYERQLRLQQYYQVQQVAQTNPMLKGMISDSLKFYIAPLPSYADPSVQEGVEQIADLLEGSTFLDVNFERVYDENQADLLVYWVKDYGGHTLGEAIFKSVVKVGLGTESCGGEWHPFDGWTVTKILWHELGHSMGFGHSNDADNIMYYQTQSKFAADYEDSVFLDEGYYQTIPFCNEGTYYYEVTGYHENNGFELYVLPQETDPASFIGGHPDATYYSDCSGAYQQAYTSFSQSCTIPYGSKLLIYNKNDLFQFDAIKLDVWIVDDNENDTPDMQWNMEDFEYDQQALDEVRSLVQEFGRV